MYNFEALTSDGRKLMLDKIGLKSLEDLFCHIPSNAKMNNDEMEKLKEGLDEISIQKLIKEISQKNKIDNLCFLGGGAKKRYVPSVIGDIASRFEFLSCYTPYQAEISQGSLEIMYEFQSMMCALTGQDVSNASVYDGASAAAEAILMASRLTKKRRVFVDENVNENYLEVIKTYLWANNIELIIDSNSDDNELCAKVYQSPNKYGEFQPMPSKNSKELIISIVDLMSLVLSEPPKSDITVGDVQSFGIGLNFGGAYAGFIACKDEYKRQLPGRISGKTVDRNGKTAYCLTLQAREQHIRREKATSNICSNQALVAFCANLYLRYLGRTNLTKIAQKSYDNAHLLAQKLSENGFEILNRDFFDEFTLEVGNSDKFLEFMKEKNILAGIKLDNSKVLVSVTELNDEAEITEYLNASKNLSLAKIAL